jgi:prepilin-type N-terminal cleavage/methylation domain-containing protein
MRERLNDKGFSLIEITIAVTMIGGLVAVMAALIAQGARAQNRLSSMRASNNLMQSEVASVESANWDDVMLKPSGANSVCSLDSSDSRVSSQIVKPSETILMDTIYFDVTRNVTWKTGGAQVLCSISPNDRQDIKVVTITLTWYPDGSSGAKTRTEKIYLSKARNPGKANL